MLLNAVEQSHMYNLYGILFQYRCDGCRKGFGDVLSKTKALAGCKTYCKECKSKATDKDTVEFVPQENRPAFLGRRDNPRVVESQRYCIDCSSLIRPSDTDLSDGHIITVRGVRKKVCNSCYKTKYAQTSKPSSPSSQHVKVPHNSPQTQPTGAYKPGTAMEILLSHFKKHKGEWFSESELQKLVPAKVSGRLKSLKDTGRDTGKWVLDNQGSRWRMK